MAQNITLVQNPSVPKRKDVLVNGEYAGAVWRGTADSDTKWTAWLPTGIARYPRIKEGLDGFPTRKAAVAFVVTYGWSMANDQAVRA